MIKKDNGDKTGQGCPRLKPTIHAGYSIKRDNGTGLLIRVGAPVCGYRGRDREMNLLDIYKKSQYPCGLQPGTKLSNGVPFLSPLIIFKVSMKTIREILVIPFYVLGFSIFALSIVVDLTGCLVAYVGDWVEGKQ